MKHGKACNFTLKTNENIMFSSFNRTVALFIRGGLIDFLHTHGNIVTIIQLVFVINVKRLR